MTGAPIGNLRDIIRRLLRRNATTRLRNLLEKTHIADVAAVLRFVSPKEQRQVFDCLPNRDEQAEVLGEADESIVAHLVGGMEDEVLVDLLGRMSPDDAADLLGRLPEERADEMLRRTRGDELEGLLHYDEETAGGIMSPDFFALREVETAESAINALRATQDVEMAFYVYVVNEHGHLVGVVSLRQLVVSAPDKQLSELMEPEVISVRPEVDREDVARMVARYDLLAVPVVDEANKLLGIVTVDDVIDVIRAEATEDILKMAGAGPEDVLEERSLSRTTRIRMPWLLASFVGGVLAAAIIGRFEVALSKVAALAPFIPIILGMGGNVGTQSSTIIVRGIATGRVDVHRFAHTVGRELLVGLALGTAYGLLLAVTAAVMYRDSFSMADLGLLAATVGLAMVASMMVAATVGSGLPLLLERLHIDPAVATGPFVTTSVDVSGVLIYFGIALALMPQLAGG